MYPTSVQRRLDKFQAQFDKDPTVAFEVLYQWALTLSRYAKKKLHSMASAGDDYRVKNKTVKLQNHLKDTLFAACAKFQEAESLSEFRNDVRQIDVVNMLFSWGDSLLLISLYFKLPFFELAIEKYQLIMQKYPQYEKEYKISRKVGTVLAEEAHFSYYTSTTFSSSPEELAKQANDHFAKALLLKPNSAKTYLCWANARERITRTHREFRVAASMTAAITKSYRKALSIKPKSLKCFDSWGVHLDWMISLYFSSRHRDSHNEVLNKLFQHFVHNFKKAACDNYISLQPLLAFALLDGTQVSPLSRACLVDLSNLSHVTKVKEEAARHLQFLDEVTKTKADTYKIHLRSAQQLFKSLPPSPLERLKLSQLTVEEIATNYDVILNALWFCADREDARNPIFHRARQGGCSSSSKNMSLDVALSRLDALSKKEDPMTTCKNKLWLGNGAFGDVYTAERKSNSTLIAMKVMKNKAEDLPHIVEEIAAMKSLSHRNIVTIEECYQFQDSITITMEYCDGGTLRDLCAEVQLVESEIAFFISQLCEGLRFIHEKGYVHRDVKSENILLNLSGTIRIADLGLIEKYRGKKGERMSMVGTSYWMAPEVIQQQMYGKEVDIWAMGCVTYELASKGRPPYHDHGSFHAMTLMSTRGAPHLASPIDPLTKSPIIQWSTEIESFLELCFQNNPYFRATASQLLTNPFLLNEDGWSQDLRRKLEVVFIGSSLRRSGLL